MRDVRRNFSSKHTGIGTEGREVVQAIKVDLTRNIANTLDDLQEEIKYGFDKEFGPCEDWTPVHLYEKLVNIVALLSGRVFVGRPLSRDDEWIKATVAYTFLCVQARDAINAYPEWARGIAAYLVPEAKRVWQFKKRGGELLKPMLDAQMAKEGHEKLHRDDTTDEQGTFISWVLKHTKEKERFDPMVLANNQMGCRCFTPGLVNFTNDEPLSIYGCHSYNGHGHRCSNLRSRCPPRIYPTPTRGDPAGHRRRRPRRRW